MQGQNLSKFISAMEKDGVIPARTSDVIPTAGHSRLIRDERGYETIYYSYSEEGDIAWGRWYSCRYGTGDKWFSRAVSDLSDADKAAWKRRREAEEERYRIETDKLQREAQREAARIYRASVESGTHDYTLSKGLSCVVRVYDKNIILPAVDATGTLWTIQRITPDGEKLFLEHGRKQGCFCPIGWSPSRDTPATLIVCEGWATGQSIHDATQTPVACAWDKGNISRVVDALRVRYPECKIIIAADNDQWTIREPRHASLRGIRGRDIPGDDPRWDTWRDKGWLINAGLETAKQVGIKYLCPVVYPEFDSDSHDKPSDFNDLKEHDKIAQVFAPVLSASFSFFAESRVKEAEHSPGSHHTPPHDQQATGELVVVDSHIEPDIHPDISFSDYIPDETPRQRVRADGKPEWFNHVIWKNEKLYEPDPKSLNNRMLYLDGFFPNLFVYNSFSDELIIRSCPPWEQRDKFRVRRVEDTDIINLTVTLERTFGFTPNIETTWNAVMAVAKKNAVNPVVEYMSGLKWDGVSRLSTWLRYYLRAESQPDEYLSTIGTMWMVAAAKRIFEPGCKYDHMLVLEGKQNLGKSTALKTLATFGKHIEECFFCDSANLSMLNNPKTCQILQGSIIVEFAELEGINKVGELTLRAWITRQEDKILKNYAKTPSYFPRQYVLAGTTNEDNWLRDTLGNRRYHPVHVTAEVRTPELKADKDQLWAEAVHLYRSGYKVYLKDDDPVYALAQIEQAKRFVEEPKGELYRAYLRDKEWTSYSSLWHGCGLNLNNLNEEARASMRSWLKTNGWEYKQAYALTKSKDFVWVRIKTGIVISDKPSSLAEVPF